jgi:aspartate aminotransferase
MSVSKRAANIAESLTLAITAKANKMKAEGVNVVGFGAGEPDFNTPDYIVAAAKEALDKGFTKYTPSGGMAKLKEAVCNKFKADNGLTYSPAQIVVSNGAKHSLHNACQALIDDGDEVIIPAPYWLTYPELVKLAGGVPVYVVCSEKNGFKMTPAQLKKAITKKTKALILNSPSNPTGAVYTPDEIAALGKVIEDAGIWVISDEIYEKLIYGKAKHVSIASLSQKLYDRTITVNGVSKTYAMTGWRIGYLGAPLAVAKAIDNMQSHTTSNANSIAQWASVAAMTGGKDFMDKLVKTFDERRVYMVEKINKMPLVSALAPEGAFYVMMNVKKVFGKTYNGKKITSAQTFAEVLLEAASAAVVPGEAFGADDYLRLSYAISTEDIPRGLDSIEKVLGELK